MTMYFVIWTEGTAAFEFIAEPYNDINLAVSRRDWLLKNKTREAAVYEKTA